MSGTTGLDRLLEHSSWVLSRTSRGVLVSTIDRSEAKLVARSGPVRAALERYFVHRRTADPTIIGLLLFVQEAGREVGFVELVCPDGTMTWNGPHGPLGPLFP